MCTYALREQMNATSAHVPSSIDEMAEAGLNCPLRSGQAPTCQGFSDCPGMPLLANGPFAVIRYRRPNNIVIGEVIGIHVADDVITDGMIDPRKVNPLARLGYLDYATLDTVFAMQRPD